MILNTLTEFGFYPDPRRIITGIALRRELHGGGEKESAGLSLFDSVLYLAERRVSVFPKQEQKK